MVSCGNCPRPSPGSGRQEGQTSFHLHTLNGQARATLDIQLGSPTNPRPGAPDVPGGRPGQNHGPQHHQEPDHQRPRRRGPSTRARDAARREAWLKKKEERQQEVPAEKENSDDPKTSNVDTVLKDTLESGETANTDPTATLESSEADSGRDDELSCDLCDHTSQTKGGLKIHVGRKHKEIPQLDGEVQIDRDTDDWWERNITLSVKTFEVYMDVLEDIKESKLSENEKHIERERAGDARMQGFKGDEIVKKHHSKIS